MTCGKVIWREHKHKTSIQAHQNMTFRSKLDEVSKAKEPSAQDEIVKGNSAAIATE